jgi:hypothetical protein
MLQVQMANSGGSMAVLNSVTLTASGSGNDASSVGAVSLYRDSNNNGIVDGGDTLLGTGVYPSDNGSLTLNFSNTIAPFTTVNYLVAYNFTPGAQPGSYQVNVTNNTSLSGTDNGNGQPLAFNGAPIGGAVVMVAAATSTPTAIPTATGTPTASSTATATSTRGTNSVLYPNPATGPGPVTVQFQLAAPAGDARVLIFTTAFRKINEISLGQVPAGTQKTALQLTDRWGSPLANGVYYVVIRGDKERYTVKLMVIR